jgi:pantothenate synthetase
MKKQTKQWVPWTIATVAVAGLALSVGTHSVSAEEYHHNPRIHRAIDALYDAHEEIDHAHHMFHDHKREALDAIDHAIDRLEIIKDYED